jgi:response regulator RpfG family c-di-GMP phosphodiesterase
MHNKSRKAKRGFSHPLFVDDLSNRNNLDRAIKHFKQLVEDYESVEGIVINASTFLFADLIRAFSRDIKKLINVDGVEKPSDFRIAGLIAFWIRKLKPLNDIESDDGSKTQEELEHLRLYLNEQFAINVGLSTLNDYATKGATENLKMIIASNSYSDILSHLRYRAISPQAMSLYYKFLVDIRVSQEETITKLVTALEFRDDETGQHVKRIGIICKILAEALSLSSSKTENLRLAAMMHDVGKIGVSDSILKKHGRLSAKEFGLMKMHTTIGDAIFEDPSSPVMSLAKIIARSHHEKWDGKGYPDSLAGDSIPFEARIVSIADSFDAMVSKRVYQEKRSIESALQEIKNNKGKQFDPKICDTFLEQIDAIRALYPSDAEVS